MESVWAHLKFHSRSHPLRMRQAYDQDDSTHFRTEHNFEWSYLSQYQPCDHTEGLNIGTW